MLKTLKLLRTFLPKENDSFLGNLQAIGEQRNRGEWIRPWYLGNLIG
jgi:hypothetical protein